MNAGYPFGDAARGTSRPTDLAVALPVVGLHHSCCREILKLNQENARLADELAKLRDDHEDLTQSAEIWIRLYKAYYALATKSAADAAQR